MDSQGLQKQKVYGGVLDPDFFISIFSLQAEWGSLSPCSDAISPWMVFSSFIWALSALGAWKTFCLSLRKAEALFQSPAGLAESGAFPCVE